MKAGSFYRPSNGSSTFKKTVENKPGTPLKQLTLHGTMQKSESIQAQNLNHVMDNPEFVKEQHQIFENIKNNKQRTLRSYTGKQKTPTSSYQNLLAPNSKNAYVVCCKEEGMIKNCIEELCSVLGLAYLKDLEEGVTHAIYEGLDQEIISLARDLGVKILTKQWLLDCISKRESLLPDNYVRFV